MSLFRKRNFPGCTFSLSLFCARLYSLSLLDRRGRCSVGYCLLPAAGRDCWARAVFRRTRDNHLAKRAHSGAAEEISFILPPCLHRSQSVHVCLPKGFRFYGTLTVRGRSSFLTTFTLSMPESTRSCQSSEGFRLVGAPMIRLEFLEQIFRTVYSARWFCSVRKGLKKF